MLQQVSHAAAPPHGLAGYVLPSPEIEAATPKLQMIETTFPEGCLLVLALVLTPLFLSLLPKHVDKSYSESLCHSPSFMSFGNLFVHVYRNF